MSVLSLNSPAFRQSRPVLLTSFTNKVGSIGLSLISILLVKRGVSTAQGTAVLSSLKATMLLGTLAGGALADRMDPRTLVLSALLMSAAGLGLLPFQTTIAAILLLGVLAQFGDALMMVCQRLLLLSLVDLENQREAIGWWRMVNNGAQIFSFSVAAAGSSLGVAPLMLFDSATSIGAFFFGRKLLPPAAATAGAPERGLEGRHEGPAATFSTFARYSLLLMGWSLLYELFLEGGSGRLEVLHPGEGLRRFSTMMILNTILCAAFAVKATVLFRDARRAVAGGVVLTACGVLVAALGMASQAWVFFGMLLITTGELMLGAVSQYTLMRLTPPGRHAGFYYAAGLTVMQCGRIAGAALAFPLLIHARGLAPFAALVAAAGTAMLALLWSVRRDVARLT